MAAHGSMTFAWPRHRKPSGGRRAFETAVGLALVWAWSALACTATDDTTAIRRMIAQGAAMAEHHDVQGLLEMTTQDFIAQPGNHRTATVRQILRMVFRHYGALQIIYPQPQVDLDPQGVSAEATVHFLMVKQERQYPELKDLYAQPLQWLETVGENADLYRLQLTLHPRKGTWRVAQAHLASFHGIGFDP
jgi:hypothetical protein